MTLTIDSDKQRVLDNGVRIFPIGMGQGGGYFAGQQANLTSMFRFRCDFSGYSWSAPPTNSSICGSQSGGSSYIGLSGFRNALPDYSATQGLCPYGGILTDAEKADPRVFARFLVDEPDIWSNPATPAAIRKLNCETKRLDPNHPTLMNVTLRDRSLGDDTIGSLTAFKGCADIMMHEPSYPVYNARQSGEEGNWARADSPFAYESRCALGAFKNLPNYDLKTYGQPVWAVVQAYGKPYATNSYGVLTGDVDVGANPKGEVRTFSYLPITVGYGGIVYWMCIGEGGTGLFTNMTEFGYYSRVTYELKSINHILTLPTLGNAWLANPGNGAVVISGTGITRSWAYPQGTGVTVQQNAQKLNWILKGDSTGTYLIVVNKDATVVTATVRIPGLSTVSGIARLVLPENSTGLYSDAGFGDSVMVNGSFTHTFPAKAVSVFKFATTFNCSWEYS